MVLRVYRVDRVEGSEIGLRLGFAAGGSRHLPHDESCMT